MVKDAEANKEADKKKRESVDVRNQADTLIHSTDKNLKEHGSKISDAEKTLVTIGSENIIREGVTIHRGTKGGGGETNLGDHNLLMGYVHIAHDCHIGNHNILSNYTGLSGHCTLDDHINLGGQNGIAQFLHIGSYVFTGGGSLIDRNIPPYSTGFGNRFEVKGVNIVGLKRKGFSREAISEILEAHRLYFRADLKSDEALRIIEETYGDRKEIREFLDFMVKTDGTA